MCDSASLQERLRTQRPVDWDQLPDFSLYMDQVLSYMDRQVIRFDEDDGLTAAMVNNYTKSGLVPRAEGKRYGPIHLGYLTAVVALKQVLSVKNIGALLNAGRATEKTPPELYAYFCRALDQALTDTAHTIDPQAQEQDLARMALDFAVRSYANQLACARILEILQPPEGHKRK